MAVKAYDELLDRFLTLVEERKSVPWRMPWTAGLPRNLFSRRPYRGLNTLYLSMSGYGSPFWATKPSILKHGGQLRSGQEDKPTMVLCWTLRHYYEFNSSGYAKPSWAELLIEHPVYNFEQTEGLDWFLPVRRPTFTPVQAAERLVEAMPLPPRITHNATGAYYYPARDEVSVPGKELFNPAEEYYSTLFHELVHSTGHATRLERPSICVLGSRNSHAYSFEELVAEIGAALLCGVCRIDNRTVANSASYVATWLRELRNDRRMLLEAATQAQKAVDFCRGKVEVKAQAVDTTEPDQPEQAVLDLHRAEPVAVAA